jgi:hypothetical protein
MKYGTHSATHSTIANRRAVEIPIVQVLPVLDL